MKPRTSKLVGHVGDAIKALAEQRENIDSYFRNDSRLWSHIKEHIWHDEDCVLIDRPKEHDGDKVSVAIYRGNGPAIRILNYRHYPEETINSLHAPPTTFALNFTVEYDCGWDTPIFVREYSLDIPTELEDDCADDEWNARWITWLDVKKRKRDHAFAAREINELKRLVDKYPIEVTALMQQYTLVKKE